MEQAQDGARTEKEGQAAEGNLRRVAYEQIIEALMSRRIRPGRLISQREIAAETGCSLSSIREALKWLEAESVVRLIPKRGIEFREITRKEVAESYELRSLIELQALDAFAARATPQQIDEIRVRTQALIDEQRRGALGPDHTVRRIETDHDLHRQIVAALDNDLVAEVHRRNETIMLLARLNLPPSLLESGPALDEHMAVLDRLAAGDVEGAKRALAHHLDSARDRSLRALVV
ncbi:hypothetical protein AVJ23_15470 [Pseudoponticoccus marisrubri]|uniref:HTH gntR-type domain-containing protein n=2 Tax=Pseudoponticoccus marisrubri TaxID=1685382 RepID=A0A0W7WGT6_9RHOB|nr:hypothetical protein AVJ23_15470 [Pseudoponticoccus marisrubri]